MTTSYKETFDRFSLYFLAIFISPIFFGVLLAMYSIISFEDSWSFGPTVLVVAIYSLPFFAYAAFPISLYIDFSARTKNYSNWVKVLIYALFGSLAGMIAVVIFDLMFFMSIFGLLGGVIYFLVIMLFKKIIK